MEEEKKISIVVPIYNVEKYLDKCLKSVYKLDLSNKEIILVNDGSSDNSLKIAENYFKENKENTKLIIQQNKGLSGARNTGIKNAMGEYIFFLDSDDFVDSESLERFLKEGIEKKQEILIGNYYEYFSEDNIRIKPTSNFYLDKKDKRGTYFLETGVKEKKFYVTAWLNLYKKDFLIKNNLFFKERLLHEDNLFTLKAFRLAKKVGYSKEIFYYYRQTNPNSIMNKKNEKNYIHMMHIIEELLKFQKNLNEENKYFNRILVGIYWQVEKEGKLKNRELFNKLKKIKLNFKERLKLLVIVFYSLYCKNINEIKEI